ncbi:helix-turn-helix domain-containing protein [bacterium]|nr:helix-turn-helix domain-containing protein [bacterium]
MKRYNRIEIRRLGAAIRERRLQADMSQADLAEKADMNRSHLSLIETGEHMPTKRTIEKIAQALNTSPDDLKYFGEIISQFNMPADGTLYPGLRELLNDPNDLLLYKITDEEKRVLKSIRLQWKNPSKRFFIEALLEYRRYKSEEE